MGEKSQPLASFKLPELGDNPAGWGPAIGGPEQDQLFSSFSRSERLGKVSDWTQTKAPATRGRANQGGNSMFSYKHEEDETSFSVVDNRPKLKPKYARKVFRKFPIRGGRGGSNRGGPGAWGSQRGGGKTNSRFKQRRGGGGRWGSSNYERVVDIKEPSIEIQESWQKIDTLDFASYNEKAASPSEAETLLECGVLEKYRPTFDTVSPKAPVPLQRFENRRHFNVTTSLDPIIQKLADQKEGNVFATDTILAVLMASPRSVNSWDLVVKKENGVIFIDKRPKSRIDFLSVNENWNESPVMEKDSVNHPSKLAEEATLINFNFSQQVLSKEEPKKFKEPSPFMEKGVEATSVAYRYRKWQLGDDIELVVRTSLNAYSTRKKPDGEVEESMLCVRALNEFDSKLSGNVDWRQKLESQPGAVLATEMKNNANKLARWTAEALLAGADDLRLGFVSRVVSKDATKHCVLMSRKQKPSAFAASIGLKPSNLWGALRHVLDKLRTLDDGTYLLYKDPVQNALAVYDVSQSFNSASLEDDGTGSGQEDQDEDHDQDM